MLLYGLIYIFLFVVVFIYRNFLSVCFLFTSNQGWAPSDLQNISSPSSSFFLLRTTSPHTLLSNIATAISALSIPKPLAITSGNVIFLEFSLNRIFNVGVSWVCVWVSPITLGARYRRSSLWIFPVYCSVANLVT